MAWRYRITSGEILDAAGTIVGRGWAGNGAGRNNASMQCAHGVGPLPRGKYTIGPPHDSPHTGVYTLNLEPSPTNEMCGRSLFRIHGASKTHPELSSDGCIIQIHPVRVAIWESKDHDLEVVL